MFRTFFISLKIDYFSAINTFLSSFQKVKLLDRFFHPLYQKRGFKIFLSILSSILTLLSTVLSNAIYLFLIYMISNFLSKNHIADTFIHVYFIFTIIGMIINTNLLNIGYKHYTSICLLSMDAKEYLLSHFLYNNVMHSLIHLFLLSLMISKLSIDSSFVLLLPIFSFFSKTIGEMINLKYFVRKRIRITENYVIYFLAVLSLLVLAFLPYFSLFFPKEFYLLMILFAFFFFLYSLFVLFSYSDYQRLVKEILVSRVFSASHNYSTRDLVEIRHQDEKIQNDKLGNKTGYDRFNAIFFERHKNILLNSSIRISILFIIILVIGIFYLENNQEATGQVSSFLKNHMSIFILIMYFINRGGIITQAMFMNCDHAMLRYHFYRNPDVIISMYQKRAKTVTMINFIPASVLGILLVLYGYLFTDVSFFYLLCSFLFILVLSIFFSIYYLVTYYLFQPYNEEFRMVSFYYSLSHLIAYIVCFLFLKVTTSVPILLIGVNFLTLILILVSYYLIRDKSCYTFRIK